MRANREHDTGFVECRLCSAVRLQRKPGATRAIDFEQNSRIVRSIANGGITRFIYGGNAFLYHLTLDEYEHRWSGRRR